jgi:hypothetical protein
VAGAGGWWWWWWWWLILRTSYVPSGRRILTLHDSDANAALIATSPDRQGGGAGWEVGAKLRLARCRAFSNRVRAMVVGTSDECRCIIGGFGDVAGAREKRKRCAVGAVGRAAGVSGASGARKRRGLPPRLCVRGTRAPL